MGTDMGTWAQLMGETSNWAPGGRALVVDVADPAVQPSPALLSLNLNVAEAEWLQRLGEHSS